MLNCGPIYHDVEVIIIEIQRNHIPLFQGLKTKIVFLKTFLGQSYGSWRPINAIDVESKLPSGKD